MSVDPFLQALPLVLLLVLLAGRASPHVAAMVALAAALVAVDVSLPVGVDLAVFLAEETPRGLFLAAQPLGVVMGGLLFHAALSGPSVPTTMQAPHPRRIFAAVLTGIFMESVTGFGLGSLLVLGRLRSMGLGGAPAGAASLLALCLVPWGALGVGVQLGAALIDVPGQAVARWTSYPSAAWLLVLGPVLWRLCNTLGVVVSRRERAVQLALLGVMAGLLVIGHSIAPFEVVGLFAVGPLLLWIWWQLGPSGDLATWRRVGRSAAPHLVLTAGIVAARAIPEPPMLRPWSDLPGLPLTHASVVLCIVAMAFLIEHPRPWRVASAALRRGARPGATLVMYLLLARWLAASGAMAAVAEAIRSMLGPLAPFAVPPLGLLAGIVTGSSIGANASLMVVQYRLGVAGGMPPLLAPGLHNFASGAGAGMSIVITTVICGLLADGTTPAHLWRLLLPSLAAVVGIGWACVIVAG